MVYWIKVFDGRFRLNVESYLAIKIKVIWTVGDWNRDF